MHTKINKNILGQIIEVISFSQITIKILLPTKK